MESMRNVLGTTEMDTVSKCSGSGCLKRAPLKRKSPKIGELGHPSSNRRRYSHSGFPGPPRGTGEGGSRGCRSLQQSQNRDRVEPQTWNLVRLCKRLNLSFVILFGQGRRQGNVLLTFFFFKENFPLWKWHVFIFKNPATGIYNFWGRETAQGPRLTLLL